MERTKDPRYPIFLPDPVDRHHPYADGLVSWWLCLPAWMGGVTWYDLMQANNGTLTSMGNSSNGWQQATTRPGGWGHLLFDGTAGYVDIGNQASVSFVSSDFTLMAWIYPTAETFYHTIFNKGDGGSAGGSQYELMGCYANAGPDHKFHFDVFQGSSNNTTVDPNTHSLNQWYHVAGVRKGSLCTLYRNGQSVASNTYAGSLNSTTNHLKIGIAGTAIPFAGDGDDFRIYNRALSAAEVFNHYLNQSSGRYEELNRAKI